MTAAEIQGIIIIACSQFILIITAILTLYFKFKGNIKKEIETIKCHTDVALTKLNGMLSYVIHSFDRPAWLKVAVVRGDGEVEFRMLEVSENYCRKFGFTRQNYLGKTDIEAGWDFNTAKEFRKNDLSIWASGEATTFTEKIGNKNIKVRKIRVQSADGISKGIFGYTVEEDEEEKGLPISDISNVPPVL